MLSWYWKAQHRALSLYIEADENVWLQMLDDGRAHTDMRPTHELLKRSVQCFFEGWLPNG